MERAIAGRFRLLDKAQADVFGEVFRGKDERTGCAVVVRALDPEIFVDETRASAVRALHVCHPGLAAIVDLVEQDARYYLIGDAVEGTTLAEIVLRAGPRPLEAAVRLALELARALGVLHRANAFHGRLDPTRVVCEGESVTIVELGLGMLLGDDSDESRPTIPNLNDPNVAFLSPEQAAAEGEPTIESDVWSLGAILHFAAFGVPPYSVNSRAKLSIATTRGLALGGSIDERVARVMSGCLAREPVMRPTIAEVVQQLTDVLESMRAPPSLEASSLPAIELDVVSDVSGPIAPQGLVSETAPRRSLLRFALAAAIVPLLALGIAGARRTSEPLRLGQVAISRAEEPVTVAPPKASASSPPVMIASAAPSPVVTTKAPATPTKRWPPARATKPASDVYGITEPGF